MKNKCRKLLTGLLAVALCLGTVSCAASTTQGDSLVYLDYATGLADNGEYNSELYGMNGINDLGGADPGVFYISEEDDAKYGGYYYMYVTSDAINKGASLDSEYYTENKITNLVALCYRSTDLYQWESCGILDGGYSCVVDEKDWCKGNFWAPEVIQNPADGKYYMYFSASSARDWGVQGMSSSSSAYDRLYLGVAVSDTPVGPFDVLYDMDASTGKRVPTINFQIGCNTEHPWAAIDVSPFFDDNGDLYLYFNKHRDDHYSHLNGIFGMKMKSMTIPDYTTVRCLTQVGSVTASSEPGKIEEVSSSGDYFSTEGGINEGPIMLKHNGKYYLTYSSNGYKDTSYSVHQAISDSPLGSFTKLTMEEGNPVLNGSLFGYMNGTAHHSIVQNGDEIWIVYHRHDSIYGYDSGWGRSIDVDRINFVTNADGLEVLTANGPTKALQWLPGEISGYKNLAQTATVSISTGSGIQYLTDGVLPYYTVTENSRMSVSEGDVTITLTWDQAVSVSSIMVYNSKLMDSAYSNISDIRFKLAEQPEWASKAYNYAVIRDIELPSEYWDAESETYIACAPVVAEFDAIKVTEIQITIKEKDRLVKHDKFGETNTALNISEIVVLGGEE